MVGVVEDEMVRHRVEVLRFVGVEYLLFERTAEVRVVDSVEQVGGRIALLQDRAVEGQSGVPSLLDDDCGFVGLLECLDDILANVEAVVGHDNQLAVFVLLLTCRDQDNHR